MIKANVILDNYKWKYKIKNPSLYFKNKISKLNKLSSFKKKKQEFSILLTNNVEMKRLNLKFRKKNSYTDVLSFPLNFVEKKNIYIGDIAISYEIVKQRSKASNFFLELDKMWIHGYFHLIGYDHKKKKDFLKMTKKENSVLNYFHNKI
jgi:probable rRNA maturation factor